MGDRFMKAELHFAAMRMTEPLAVESGAER
jgi:hypothetical protein